MPCLRNQSKALHNVKIYPILKKMYLGSLWYDAVLIGKVLSILATFQASS